MPPRVHTLPPAQTESAREARKAFFCELCQKGYARMQDFENHESSYDHQHRKRMKDMKQLIKDPSETAKAKAAEQRTSDKNGMQTISLSSFAGNKGGLDYSNTKKKPVFATVTQSKASQIHSGSSVLGNALNVNDPSSATSYNDPSGAVRNGWYQDRYDPKVIRSCEVDCTICNGETRRYGTSVLDEARSDHMENEVT